MNYALLQNFKIYDIKNKILKKAAPKKDVRNPNGFTNDEKQKAIFLLMKKFNISESQAINLFYSKSGYYREELLDLEKRSNEKKYSGIVESGHFRFLFGNLKYNKMISDEIVSKNLLVVKAIPKTYRNRRSYNVNLRKIKLIFKADNGSKIVINYFSGKILSKEGICFKARKKFLSLAKQLNGNMFVSFTAKTKYVVETSKDIDKIMNQ
jgi:hypothetical protein